MSMNRWSNRYHIFRFSDFMWRYLFLKSILNGRPLTSIVAIDTVVSSANLLLADPYWNNKQVRYTTELW